MCGKQVPPTHMPEMHCVTEGQPPSLISVGHEPHSITPPHPSLAGPHCTCTSMHVFGWQGTTPQTFGIVAPQALPGGQLPHRRTLPHPSSAAPQSKPCS